ncbi:ABC transporter permease [Amycolatopsis sp.]|uniref:ABC transporter permease n=1 Tax=Amycolatopsis sp. TaxID=37632 RepID=UPI002C6AA4C4|nr:ABC transporter permease [Amycolatopsis sp.]HVV10457.1 ABC transporter permease [Amycolatopsis sp.]
MSTDTRERAGSRLREVAGRAWASPMGKTAVILLGVLVVAAVFAPLLAPFDPAAQNLLATDQAPSWLGGAGGHPLGTDGLGRDVLSRILYGLRLSLAIAVLTATGSAVLGLALGLPAGFYERTAGAVLLRLADIQFAVPFVAVGIALAAVFGPGVGKLMIVLAIWGWTSYARTIAGTVAQVRRMDFITAARTQGLSTPRILHRHVAPNVLGPVLILWSTTAGVLVLVESALSLLGLGVQPPGVSLGAMLADGQSALRLAWWSVAAPGVVLVLIVLAFNMLGDALRDAFSPGSGKAVTDPELT